MSRRLSIASMTLAVGFVAADAGAALRVTSPQGGETWSAGSQHHITWEADQSDGAATMGIAYTTDGGERWTEIVRDAPSSGRFLWTVPDDLSGTCRIRMIQRPSGHSARSAAEFSIVRSQAVSDYRWVNVTRKAAFAPRDGAGALTFRGRMWLIGGWNPGDKTHFPRICNNEVWSSSDGAQWTLAKPNTFVDDSFDPTHDWEGRHTAGYVVHQDKLWIIGGDVNQRHYQFDIWNSADGRDWSLVNRDRPVPWGPRALHYTFAFRDKIWVVGGQTMPAFAPSEEIFYRDIWNSSDGIHWKRITPREPYWPARGMIGGSVVFQGRIWILGGGTYDTPRTPQRKFYNDVWSSPDGIKWTRHVEFAPWEPRQYHDVAVFDGRMWVMEGYSKANRNDVWYSADGVNWYELPETPWKPRHAASVFVHHDALWMVAGNNMESDVWKLQRSARTAAAR